MKNQSSIWDNEYAKSENKWKKDRTTFPINFKGKNVLEIGVGNGKNLKEILRQKPYSLIAVDISEVAIEKCEKYVKNSNIKLLKEDLLSNSFKNNQFDVIICYYVLNNLLKNDRIKAVKEIKRILCPNGIILFEDFSNGDYRQYSKETANKKIEENTLIRKSGIIQHFFTKEEIKYLFSDFKKVKIKEISFKQIKLFPNLNRKIIQAIIYDNK